ncbi:DUF6199 family natural product biosynthesis protein [Paenibacillus donghaensis]|uniref:DUF6199 family natural product biosynthesis protein n=1 Tax=Paenibacillus donghaensis TaxID=414771 RepID=UPI003A10266F
MNVYASFLGILLIVAGLIMLVKPKYIWAITEKWKSEGAEDPSFVYIVSIRLGGFICAIIALLCFYALSL